jgi:peptidoglycan hydrolase-like protein with peptidoglycan-binding domain
MSIRQKRSASLVFSLALILASVVPVWAVQSVTVPDGTVIPLRMDTYLSSDSSRVGDRFTATVSRDVIVDGRVVIPTGSKVEGHVTGVERAERSSKPGSIAVGFDRIIYSNNYSVPIDGSLTTLNEEARRKIEGDIDAEDRVSGSGRGRRAIVFIGGGAGAGAVIGAIAGGGKGAAVGAGVGAVLGTIGVLLGKGDKAEVQTGTEFGLRVERSFTISPASAGVAGARYDDRNSPNDTRYVENTGAQSSTVFTSADSIRSAQMVLRDRGFYDGPINGVMNQPTRNALRQFQRDRNLAASGDLDLSTARALGIASEGGREAVPVEITNPRAERIDRNTIRISVEAQTRGRGRNAFLDTFVSGNTLHVYIRSEASQGGFGRTETLPLTANVDNASGVTRVIFHGAARDISVDLADSTTGGGSGTGTVGTSKQIGFMANRLLSSYQRDLNVRQSRGQVVFDTNRGLRQNEVELLFVLHGLKAAADLYDQMIASVTDPGALRGAADAIARQARLVNRLLKRGEAPRISSTVTNDWEQFRAELSRINPDARDLDTDIDRIR